MSVPGPYWAAGFSPPRHFNQVPVGLVQDQLRGWFARWGLPGRLRVDNGSPWGSWSDLPPPLALWLVGLGVEVIWNPPRQPQRNGVVERSHGVASAWAEPDRCVSPEQLQGRLDREDRVQRDEYPLPVGLPRSCAYPGLAHSGRAYSPAWEATAWDWVAVLRYLGGYAVTRRVDGCGKIGLYHTKPYVGVVNRGREVVVQLDANSAEWVAWDGCGRELCRRPLTQLDDAGLRALPR
jgi:hypothetical protein